MTFKYSFELPAPVVVVLITHAIYPVDEWIAATVAHSQPVTAEEDYVDVAIPAEQNLIVFKVQK